MERDVREEGRKSSLESLRSLGELVGLPGDALARGTSMAVAQCYQCCRVADHQGNYQDVTVERNDFPDLVFIQVQCSDCREEFLEEVQVGRDKVARLQSRKPRIVDRRPKSSGSKGRSPE